MKSSLLFCSFLCSVVLLFSSISIATTDENNNLSDEYINFPEHFIHININCKICMISRPTNAGCVIPKDNKILLIKDNHTKKFGLPGGKKNHHEPASIVAQRHTFEETGLIISIDDFVSEFKNGFRLYKCKIIKDTNNFNKNKTIEMKYVDKKELGEMLKKDNRKNIRFPHELDLIYSKFEWIIK